MGTLSTYAELKSAVQDWLGRSDLSAQIPVFIRLAEQRMNRDLRLRVMERRATLDVDAATSQVSLPWRRTEGDWDVFLEMRDLVWLASGETKPINLLYSPPDTYACEKSQSGRPLHYTIIGRDLFLLPAPDTDGTLYLTYYAEIPPLGDKQSDNEVLAYAPDLYLYATLVESSPYTRGSAPVEMWAKYYDEARNRVSQTEQHARYTAGLAMKPCRRI